MSFIIRQILDLKENISRRKVGVASRSNFRMSWLCGVITSRIKHSDLNKNICIENTEYLIRMFMTLDMWRM